jgi:hypothetical protein
MTIRAMNKNERVFYTVNFEIRKAPFDDYLMHGYESKWKFYMALSRLSEKWQGRTGECIDKRHDFMLIRFLDTPGGKPDEEWIPRYMLEPADTPDYVREMRKEPDETEEELDQIFGFDEH